MASGCSTACKSFLETNPENEALFISILLLRIRVIMLGSVSGVRPAQAAVNHPALSAGSPTGIMGMTLIHVLPVPKLGEERDHHHHIIIIIIIE